MKTVTKVIATIVGAVTSFFSMACERPIPRVYGPRPVEEIDKPAASEIHLENLPETNDEAVGDVYGPPSVFFAPENEDGEDADDKAADPTDGDPGIQQPVQPQVMPSDTHPVAPIYGMAPITDVNSDSPKPSNRPNAAGSADEDVDDTINQYQEAARPKPPVTKYGIRPKISIIE